jgi:hypothetical protein
MKITDSGTRDTFQTGAVRDGQVGKGRFDLLPFDAIARVAKIFEAGAAKYADRNWEKGIPTHRFIDSGLRHAFKHLAGHKDEDHLAMAAWNFLCLIQTEHWIRKGKLPTDLHTLPYPLDDRLGSTDHVRQDQVAHGDTDQQKTQDSARPQSDR